MNIFKIVDTEYLKSEGYARLPLRATRRLAGYDFYCPIDIKIEPGESTGLIFTNIKAKLDDDKFLMMVPRSSWGLKGISIAFTVGIVDADYYGNDKTDGNIGFALRNNSSETIYIKKDERIVQGIIVPYGVSENCNSDSVRSGGYGSTDSDNCLGSRVKSNIVHDEKRSSIGTALRQMFPLITIQFIMLFCKLALKANISWNIALLPTYIFMFVFVIIFIIIISSNFKKKGE